jgi:hypothetical protein
LTRLSVGFATAGCFDTADHFIKAVDLSVSDVGHAGVSVIGGPTTPTSWKLMIDWREAD